MMKVTPLEHSAAFGATVEGIDVTNLDDATFLALQSALYTHKLLVIKGQHSLTPSAQFQLNCRFDPTTSGAHGGKEDAKTKSAIPTNAFSTDLPDAPEVRIVGKGLVEAGHFGTTKDQILPGGTHVGFHETPLTEEELDNGDTRLWRWHIDAPLWPKSSHTARVTTLWCHTLPTGPDLTVRFDDGTGRTMKCRPGVTAFIECSNMYKNMTEEQKKLVENSYVEYAPMPYMWTKHCKSRSDGFFLYSQGLETPLEDLPPQAHEEEVQILPMLWPNAMIPDDKAFMVHSLAARKLHLKTSPDGPVEIVEDIAKVRQIIDDLQRPFLTEENILFSPYEEGDLALWLNRSCRHTAVEFPMKYGPRVMHQCHLVASDPVENPTPIPLVAF